MTHTEQLEQLVYDAYAAHYPGHDEWTDWLAAHHLPFVADKAVALARRFGADPDLARAGALVHDIADINMSRFADGHDEASLTIGHDLMQQAGFGTEDIALVVDDAVRHHACHGGRAPDSLEGKVLAAADAMAHLQTDFYIFATWFKGRSRTLEEAKSWTLKKLERDFHDKLQLAGLQDELRVDYELIKALFSR